MSDEAEIRDLIERWAKAVRKQDIEGVLADHSQDMLMFDVPPPVVVQGHRCLSGDLAGVFQMATAGRGFVRHRNAQRHCPR